MGYYDGVGRGEAVLNWVKRRECLSARLRLPVPAPARIMALGSHAVISVAAIFLSGGERGVQRNRASQKF
jgi:hypothetical protein